MPCQVDVDQPWDLWFPEGTKGMLSKCLQRSGIKISPWTILSPPFMPRRWSYCWLSAKFPYLVEKDFQKAPLKSPSMMQELNMFTLLDWAIRKKDELQPVKGDSKIF